MVCLGGGFRGFRGFVAFGVGAGVVLHLVLGLGLVAGLAGDSCGF